MGRKHDKYEKKEFKRRHYEMQEILMDLVDRRKISRETYIEFLIQVMDAKTIPDLNQVTRRLKNILQKTKKEKRS